MNAIQAVTIHRKLRKQAAIPSMLKFMLGSWALPPLIGGVMSGMSTEGSFSDKLRAGGSEVARGLFNPEEIFSNLVSYGIVPSLASKGVMGMTGGGKTMLSKGLGMGAMLGSGLLADRMLSGATGSEERRRDPLSGLRPNPYGGPHSGLRPQR